MRRWILGAVLGLTVVFGAAAAALLEPDIPAADLEARFGGPASRFVDVAGVRAHFRDEGTGPVVVLLHGTGASLHTWDGWVAELADSFRIVRVDLPGFGLTGPRADHDYRIQVYADFVAAFAGRLGLDRFALAGNSLGGQIAWNFALQHPERVERLILVDPAGAPSHSPPSLAFRLARTPGARHLLRVATPRSFIERNLHEVYGDASLVTPDLVDRYHALTLREGNRDAFVARARLREHSRFDELGRLSVPTLIQWGERDRWIPVEQARLFADAIPGAELILYPDAGHVPMEEIPAATARDARAFLRASRE